ncbi:unnamed protein product [Strongylus vulgaris]|uniref:MSP domain-containing protein n=1 Tax=Strongylus vulgaris TaxID=40348 RepID=A0A3P7KK51_STRVU|nr:unnamed protein product [Strongylus vulgaris]
MALEDVFNKIYLNPTSVSFMHSPQRQNATLTITNYSNENVIFKMKSTHPRTFKMNPVFGIVESRKEVDVRLTFKGIRGGKTLENER